MPLMHGGMVLLLFPIDHSRFQMMFCNLTVHHVYFKLLYFEFLLVFVFSLSLCPSVPSLAFLVIILIVFSVNHNFAIDNLFYYILYTIILRYKFVH